MLSCPLIWLNSMFPSGLSIEDSLWGLRALTANACVQDNILMPIRGAGEGLQDEDEAQGESSRDAERLVYVLHPNCAVEEV